LLLHGIGKLLSLARDSNSPLKGPVTGTKRTAVALRLAVSEVRAVGYLLCPGATINDTLCALLAGALRRYFVKCALHPDQMVVRVAIPVNMRPVGAPAKMENVFALTMKSLPVHLPTAAGRVAAFRARMRLLRLGPEASLGLVLMGLFSCMPAWALHRVVDYFTFRATAIVTNVSGPRAAYRLAGHPLDDGMFWVPTAGILGLGVSLFSYQQTITVGLVADAGVLGDLQPLIEALHAEWAEMRREAQTCSPNAPLPPDGLALLAHPAVSLGLPASSR
jgi:diacylglycerol O-acyltransferase